MNLSCDENYEKKIMEKLIHDEQINDDNEIQENRDDEENEEMSDEIILLQHEVIDRVDINEDEENKNKKIFYLNQYISHEKNSFGMFITCMSYANCFLICISMM